MLWSKTLTVQYFGDFMKKKFPFIGLSVVAILLIIVAIAVGCSARENKFDVSGEENEKALPGYISSVNEIDKLVTNDEKLVINYFDAYIWVVHTDNEGSIERMTYIYEFESQSEAMDMVSIRSEELVKNRTMTILRCKAIGKYVVVDLIDTSFDNVNRLILEHNFSGLIIY